MALTWIDIKELESIPMSKWPKQILAYCERAADHTFIPGSNSTRLTPFAAHNEFLSSVPDGIHVLEFGGEYQEYDWESGYKCNIPDWWFLSGSDFEVVANPVKFVYIDDLINSI